MMKRYFVITLVSVLCVGCHTAQPKTNSKAESVDQTVAALGTVTEGLTNQNISKEDLKNLAKQVKTDPQAKSAVQVINQALNAHQSGVKYCPIDGQRFDAAVDECPVHKIKLKIVE